MLTLHDEKRKFRRFLYSKVTILFLCLALFFVGRATYRVYQKEKESAENLAIAQNQLNDLTLRNDNLRKDIARLQSPEGVEQEIREKFRVAKPGEEMALIVDTEATATDISPLPNESWWRKAWNWIW